MLQLAYQKKNMYVAQEKKWLSVATFQRIRRMDSFYLFVYFLQIVASCIISIF